MILAVLEAELPSEHGEWLLRLEIADERVVSGITCEIIGMTAKSPVTNGRQFDCGKCQAQSISATHIDCTLGLYKSSPKYPCLRILMIWANEYRT